MKKSLFPIDALMVWCPTWSKNLWRTLFSRSPPRIANFISKFENNFGFSFYFQSSKITCEIVADSRRPDPEVLFFILIWRDNLKLIAHFNKIFVFIFNLPWKTLNVMVSKHMQKSIQFLICLFSITPPFCTEIKLKLVKSPEPEVNIVSINFRRSSWRGWFRRGRGGRWRR